MAKIVPLSEKVFALKSSAVRAAKQENLTPDQYTVEQLPSKTVGGVEIEQWHVVPKRSDKIEDLTRVKELLEDGLDDLPPEPEEPAQAPPVAEVKTEPVTPPAPAPKPTPVDDLPRPPLKIVDMTDPAEKAAYEAENPPELVVANVSDPKSTEAKIKEATRRAKGSGATKIPKWATNRGHSVVENPVAVAWALADEMTAANGGNPPKRKDYIQEAEKRGLAYGTSRSQYQSWFTARKESIENAAKANAKK